MELHSLLLHLTMLGCITSSENIIKLHNNLLYVRKQETSKSEQE
jgi:hypothetical protein